MTDGKKKVNEIKVLYLGYFLQLSKIVQSVHTAATTYNKNRQEKCWQKATRNEMKSKHGLATEPRSTVSRRSDTVWPAVGVKSSPIFPKVAQKVANAVFKRVRFFKIAKKSCQWFGLLLLEILLPRTLKIAKSGHTCPVRKKNSYTILPNT